MLIRAEDAQNAALYDQAHKLAKQRGVELKIVQPDAPKPQNGDIRLQGELSFAEYQKAKAAYEKADGQRAVFDGQGNLLFPRRGN